MNIQDGEYKSIFQIVEEGTIVFSNADIDCIISLTASGLKWWFLCNDGKYSLAETLHAHHDLKRVSIPYARKLANDWFEYEFAEFNKKFNGGTPLQIVDPKEKRSADPIKPEKPAKSTVTGLIEIDPKIKPQKKDAHTEHCCIIHKFCKYDKPLKCTVLTPPYKKQSYVCRCKEYENK